jgi:hypothetical protein
MAMLGRPCFLATVGLLALPVLLLTTLQQAGDCGARSRRAGWHAAQRRRASPGRGMRGVCGVASHWTHARAPSSQWTARSSACHGTCRARRTTTSRCRCCARTSCYSPSTIPRGGTIFTRPRPVSAASRADQPPRRCLAFTLAQHAGRGRQAHTTVAKPAAALVRWPGAGGASTEWRALGRHASCCDECGVPLPPLPRYQQRAARRPAHCCRQLQHVGRRQAGAGAAHQEGPRVPVQLHDLPLERLLCVQL